MNEKEKPEVTDQQLKTIYSILETAITAYGLLFPEEPEENPPAEEAEKTE